MSVQVTQTCDGCGTKRGVGVEGTSHTQVTLRYSGGLHSDGWQQLRDGQDLCGDCIKKALAK